MKKEDYAVIKIAENTYKINDFDLAECYLIVGSKKALLIDTGVGVGNLRGCISDITNLPLDVVCTHGHVDHIGGQVQFDKIYINELDLGKNYKNMSSYNLRKFFTLVAFTKDKRVKLKDVTRGKLPEVIGINDKFTFDLGDRIIRIKCYPGHTIGSIVLYDDLTKLMFIGDDISTSTWLFLPHAASVETWLNSAKEIYNDSKTYTPYWGHEGGKLPTEMIQKNIELGTQILNKYKRNRIISTIKAYPKNDRINGSIVFITGNIYNK